MRRSVLSARAVALLVATAIGVAACGTQLIPAPASSTASPTIPTITMPASPDAPSAVPSVEASPAGPASATPGVPASGAPPASEVPSASGTAGASAGASASASPAAIATGLPAIPKDAIPILYYHRVVAPPRDYKDLTRAQRTASLSYTVLPEAFAAQLDWLKEHGYTTILPRDLAAHWDLGTRLPTKPVMITFDDGTHDWMTTVLPMLEERGMIAEFYVTLDAVRLGALSWNDVRALAQAGNGIGSHFVHHKQLVNLGHSRPDASKAVMWREVSRSRVLIGQNTGVVPDSVAYVGGGFNATLQELVQKAGYTTARSILRGIVPVKERRYALPVVAPAPRDDVLSVPGGLVAPGLPMFTAKMHGVSHPRR